MHPHCLAGPQPSTQSPRDRDTRRECPRAARCFRSARAPAIWRRGRGEFEPYRTPRRFFRPASAPAIPVETAACMPAGLHSGAQGELECPACREVVLIRAC
ncbi:hypothetical protein E2562_027041 [Oryza meyeriana var. granulata]|uniref:Uncharacterized protein n=1 Tax=Oryza meyeriana var. granulata TaxID=110450 RepID=A0A6G1C9A7_9ORYZ|nr:hypothetical protein E2562_027041 [Oryza meyeriana var. granulata]